MNINQFFQKHCSIDAKFEDSEDRYENEQDGHAINIVESVFGTYQIQCQKTYFCKKSQWKSSQNFYLFDEGNQKKE